MKLNIFVLAWWLKIWG